VVVRGCPGGDEGDGEGEGENDGDADDENSEYLSEGSDSIPSLSPSRLIPSPPSSSSLLLSSLALRLPLPWPLSPLFNKSLLFLRSSIVASAPAKGIALVDLEYGESSIVVMLVPPELR
jgi:hypothetical protein